MARWQAKMMQTQTVETSIRAMLDERATELAQRWLDSLLDHLPLQPERLLPRRALLDPAPLLLHRLADAAGGSDLLGHEDVRETLRALASLRRSQGYSAAEMGQEFELLGEILLDEAEVHARERGVELRVVEPLPGLRVDATRVGLILMNLISNAIKYSDPARELRWVRLACTRLAPRRWEVELCDNGLGIPLRQQREVFEPYERGSAPPTVEGEGLGLPLARRAAAQLGSELVLTSTPGLGTCFRFVLGEAAQA